LWRYRDELTLAIGRLGVPHKLDVTLPFGRLADFAAGVPSLAEPHRVVLFGHLGDGNLHVNVLGPDPHDGTVDDRILSAVIDLGGSISAEHGIGRAKTTWLARQHTPADLDAMRAIKHALDPTGILNPGVIFPAP
jgi:FAD/FMN-containing dehydrogenase